MMNSDYLAIKKEIRLHAKDMNQWWKNLQEDSVAEWMLLTTFGCWGIPNQFFMMVSFILTILFFSGKLSNLQHKHSFFKSESLIFKKITNANISTGDKEKLFCRVKKFIKNRNILFIIYRNWRFILGYTFLMTSFLYNLLPYLHK